MHFKSHESHITACHKWRCRRFSLTKKESLSDAAQAHGLATTRTLSPTSVLSLLLTKPCRLLSSSRLCQWRRSRGLDSGFTLIRMARTLFQLDHAWYRAIQKASPHQHFLQ